MAPRRGVMSIPVLSKIAMAENAPLDQWLTPMVETGLGDTGNCVHDGNYYRVAVRKNPMTPF